MVQLVTTVLKFVPLAVIGVVGLFFIDGGNYEPFAPHGASLSLLSTTAALTLWAFIGLESATVPADEVKDPERTIPRATILGTVVATLALHRRDGRDHGHHPDRRARRLDEPVRRRRRHRLRRRLGQGHRRWWRWSRRSARSTAGSCSRAACRWRPPRTACSRRAFARVHGKRRTPVFGLVVSSVLVTGLMLMNYTKGLVGRLHVRDPAGHADHAGAVRLLGGGAGVAVARRARAFQPQAPRPRRGHRRARLRLQRVGDRRRRRGHRHQGLRAAAGRHPGLHRHALVAAARARSAVTVRRDPADRRARSRRPAMARCRASSTSAATRRLYVGSEVGDAAARAPAPARPRAQAADAAQQGRRCCSTTCSGSSAPARSTTRSPTRSPSAASRCSTSSELLAETLDDRPRPATRCSTRDARGGRPRPVARARRCASGWRRCRPPSSPSG